MTIRYFNIKEGNPDVMGSMVAVDKDAPLEVRIKKMYEGYHIDFKHDSTEGDIEVYVMICQDIEYVPVPDRDMLGGRINVPHPIEKGKPNLVKLSVDREGVLKLYEEGRKKIFIYEVSKKDAESGGEFVKMWDLQRAYIFE